MHVMVKGVDEIRVSRRHVLSKKELKKLRKIIEEQYHGFPMESIVPGKVEYAEVGGVEFYIVEGLPAFFAQGERLVPVLQYLLKKGYRWLPRVIVDRGATSAVGRGADLMIPGIRGLDDFDKGSIVVIVDEEAGVPVGIGEALVDSSFIRGKLESGDKKGKAIKNIHRPGDKIWKYASKL